MKSNKKLQYHSVNEIFLELKKIKVNIIKDSAFFITEISKKQRVILDAFGIDVAKINCQHSY